MNFEAFPKIPRLKRELVITEKIDGTNAQVYIREKNEYLAEQGPGLVDVWFKESLKTGAIVVGDFILWAGSRNRWLSQSEDNYGFWQWVNQNAGSLVRLGVGRHFGEWWGLGIQRGYGLSERRFSLFNTARWGGHNPNTPGCCSVVPVLYQGPWVGNGSWSTNPDAVPMPEDTIAMLRWKGSYAAPGFMDPEGIVVFHKASNSMFKVTCKDDESPKSKA